MTALWDIKLARDMSQKDKVLPPSFWDGGIGDGLGSREALGEHSLPTLPYLIK